MNPKFRVGGTHEGASVEGARKPQKVWAIGVEIDMFRLLTSNQNFRIPWPKIHDT